MSDWRERAQRGQSLLADDSSEEATRTRSILSHVLDESNKDDYISKDFFIVQQTAGGLPDTMTFDQFVAMVSGHVREDLAISSFDPEVDNDNFRTAVVSFDRNIKHHMTFLNGVVHQIAPGEVHLGLWQLILDARSDDSSVYSCYKDYLVDG
jgi:hypothetical protein